MNLCRALLFENGGALGVFYDYRNGGRSVVVLEPCGACFTHVHQDGSIHRQLTEYCRRNLVPLVAAVLRFRNAHSPRPFLCQRILHAGSTQEESCDGSSAARERSRRRAPPRRARWPVAATDTAAAAAVRGEEEVGGTLCTFHANGAVEVRAAGGNARLTLSASRTVAEVDYAVAVPGSTAAAGADADSERNEGGVHYRRWPADAAVWGQKAAEAAVTMTSTVERFTGRAWVNRQLLVGTSPCDAPPEFAHALAVALRASPTPAAAAAADGDDSDDDAVVRGTGDACGEGATSCGLGLELCRGGELVSCELPLPEDRPDHPSWAMVGGASPDFDNSDHFFAARQPLGNDDWRILARREIAAAAAAAAAPAPSAATATAGLLSVDVMKLAEGRGYAGGLAVAVESVGGCTYRVVMGAGAGRGVGGSGDKVNVHVIVHADGTEVWLDGDFVRLVRPPARPPSSCTAQERRWQRRRRPNESDPRLLHASAVSTIHFRVPSPPPRPPPPPCPPSGRAVGLAASTARPSAPSCWSSGDAFSSESMASTAAAAAAAEGGMWTSLSLGEITARALDLRRQFMASSAQVTGGGRGAGGTHAIWQASEVKIKPPTLVMPGSAVAAATAAAAAGQCPIRSSPAAAAAPTSGAVAPEPVSNGSTATVSVSVERGGASFVAYADGRARGIFADRTIVTLGAPFAHHSRSSMISAGSATTGGILAQEGDRAVECIRPDGTVARLTRLALDPNGRLLCSAGRVGDEMGLLAGLGFDSGDRNGGGGSISGIRLGLIGPDLPATRRAGHGLAPWASPAAIGGSAAAFARSGIIAALEPYVVAVLRFARWAAAAPDDRRVAAEKQAAGRMEAGREAERNRRFVELQRLIKPKIKTTAQSPPAAIHVCRKPFGWKGSRNGCGSRQSGEWNDTSRGADDDKENMSATVARGWPGRLLPREGAGARERNALVSRLLEANREVLLGKGHLSTSKGFR